MNVRAVSLPEGEDPDSQSKKLGTSAFQHFLESEVQDIILFKAKLLLDEVENDPIKKSEAVREIVHTIAKIS
ncbi:MAG: DNA primase, partial [Bacteroidota bacterium]